MKTRFMALTAGFLLVAGTGTAFAQAVVIAPEQETVIREYITANPVDPIEAPADVEITVGATLPETVEVRELEVPEIETRYSYVVVDGRTVLVEPGTRKIVHIID